MNKGIFCISIDYELLWGRKDLDTKPFIPLVSKERKIIGKILELLRKYNIPATWAVVGRISEKGNSLWHGSDTIDKIKKVNHQEIASHSYSHEIFTDIDKESAEKEIQTNKAKSFVFPRNRAAYLQLLKKNGFICFRGPDETAYELLIPRIPPVYKPRLKQGLVEIPGSMYFVSGRGIRKYIPKNLRFIKCRLGINHAIKKKCVFHIWFHPVDFANDTVKLFSDFEKILKYAAKKRELGLLKVKNMGQIASEYLSQRFNRD